MAGRSFEAGLEWGMRARKAMTGRDAEAVAARLAARKSVYSFAGRHKKGLMVGAGAVVGMGALHKSPWGRESMYSSGRRGVPRARSSGGYTYGG